MNNFFIDSTVWIEFFRGKNKVINDFVIPLIDGDNIFYNGIILSELLVGAINEREFLFLKENFEGFNYLEIGKTIFEKASEIGFRLRRDGITVPITDLVIAAHCIYHDLTIVTIDEHFNLISKKSKLKTRIFQNV